MEKGLISVIIPVYNGEDYLKECIDSIRNQTYTNLQIIIVNDGSTDNTRVICEQYAEKDKRIQVVNQENAGVGAARKTGLAYSSGEYIGFADADDWLERNMYEKLQNAMASSACDMVASGTYRQFGGEYTIDRNRIRAGLYNRQEMEQEVIPYMLYNGIYFQMGVRPNVVNKLFRRDRLEKVLDKVPDVITYGEDAAVTYSYILHSRTVFLMDEAYYHYRQHGSSASQAHNAANELERIRQLYTYLHTEFSGSGLFGMLAKQLDCYISHILIQRYSWIYDNGGTVFSIFGGVEPGKKIGIYGAGKFGKQIYHHIQKLGMDFIWVDRNDSFYRKQGFPVRPVSELDREKCDVIFISVIDQNMAVQIENQLTDLGTGIETRRLDINYITSDKVLNGLGFGRE